VTFQLEDSFMDFSIKNYAAFLITLSQGRLLWKLEASSDGAAT
jgi:hypothetical protein